MVRKRIFPTRKMALSEVKKRRKKKDLQSGVFKIEEGRFVVGTYTQARRTKILRLPF